MTGRGRPEDVNLYALLEALSYKLGICVRVEDLRGEDDLLASKGGLCVVRGDSVILIDRRLDLVERCQVMIRSLARLDLSSVFVPPLLRDLIEECRQRP